MRMRAICLAAALLALPAVPAAAQGDPLTGALYNFFDFGPGQAQPPSPQQYGGEACGSSANVWWGRFAGGRDVPPGGDTYSAEGCFPSRGACLAWLRDLKGRYSARPLYNQCRDGYQPGAAVPPWWSNASD